ncbi:sel1 repeat family protein (plasmid) [Bartonella sp. HY329]|uniref:tetratricopeptide repeat protein n=1 Tax=unclassified Bartonella TaxID=2645622 RepID=UPI0021C89B21|nr:MULTISPECIES: tetratricopeptide repeat protein [unclassified Bartonella]UXM96588.1 sel1 repeat family protein [Bartonella sp. HY329]UXN10911.1 sel1 repeat family protein [Bartonella sp. HY328]
MAITIISLISYFTKTEKSRILYQKATEQGDPSAQYQLGSSYRYGFGEKKRDGAEALKWFELAANQGHIGAQRSLGMMYLLGEDIKIDTAKGLKWLERAANQNDSNSQYFLATIYEEGKRVPVDKKLALKWLERAAEQKLIDSQRFIQRINENSDDPIKHDAEAIKLLTRASEQGSERAKTILDQLK